MPLSRRSGTSSAPSVETPSSRRWPVGFRPTALQQDLLDGGLPAALPERLLDVELVVVQQAQVELAVGRQAHAVARAAVGLAHRRDEADDAAAAGEAEVARLVGGASCGASGSSGPSSASIRRRVSAVGTNCDSATWAASPPPSGISSMKRTCQSRSCARARELHHVHVVVVAGDRAVELDRDEPGLLRRRDAGLHLLERGEAHQLLEPLGVERVHVDVEPPQARARASGFASRGSRIAVGRHRQVLDALDRGDPLGDLDDLRPQRRLAAGEPELVEARPPPRRARPSRSPRRSRARATGRSSARAAACSRRSAGCSGRSATAAGS